MTARDEFYEDRMARFYEGMTDAGRVGEPFESAFERVAAEEDVDVSDGTRLVGMRTWARARVKALPWMTAPTGDKSAAVVTSGGTRAVLTIKPGLPGVLLSEVTPDGVAWRAMDLLPTASQLIDKWGLTAPGRKEAP